MSQSPRIGRWAIEFLVIVASILMAFGIDAGWEERGERVEEAEILDGLLREFRGYEQALGRSLDRHAEMFDAMEGILAAMETGEWIREDRTLERVIGETRG
jgi:hypothetical protein